MLKFLNLRPQCFFLTILFTLNLTANGTTRRSEASTGEPACSNLESNICDLDAKKVFFINPPQSDGLSVDRFAGLDSLVKQTSGKAITQTIHPEDIWARLEDARNAQTDLLKTKIRAIDLPKVSNDKAREMSVYAEALGISINDSPCDKPLEQKCKDLVNAQLHHLVQIDVYGEASEDTKSLSKNTNLKSLNEMRGLDWYRGLVKSETEDALKYLNVNQPAIQKRQAEILAASKTCLRNSLSRFVPDEAMRDKLMRKVDSVQLNTKSDCFSANVTKFANLAPTLQNNAFYRSSFPGDQTGGEIKMCPGFSVGTNSEYTHSFIIGHELAHSIDPCMISREPINWQTDAPFPLSQNELPYSKLVTCLRSKESAEAVRLNRSDITLSKNIRNFPLSRTELNSRQFCTQREFDTETGHEIDDHNHGDEIGEVFADFIGLEVSLCALRALNPNLTREQNYEGVRNIGRFFCRSQNRKRTKSSDLIASTHPRSIERINRIIAVNPTIRSAGWLRCGPVAKGRTYCGNTTRPAATQKPANSTSAPTRGTN